MDKVLNELKADILKFDAKVKSKLKLPRKVSRLANYYTASQMADMKQSVCIVLKTSEAKVYLIKNVFNNTFAYTEFFKSTSDTSQRASAFITAVNDAINRAKTTC